MDYEKKYDEIIQCVELLKDDGKLDEAILGYSSAIEWANGNRLLKLEMQARNLLADLHRKNGDVDETLSQYGKVIELGREHNLRFTDEYVQALYHTVGVLTHIQPPPPQMFTLADELVAVRSKMVDGDENDIVLQNYKMIQEILKRTYRRKHHLRKTQKAIYTNVVNILQ